jgi:hypothetical protein
MAVSPEYARSLMGQWVDCHTPYGMRSGILREVRPDGIVIEMPRTIAGYANGKKGEQTDYTKVSTSVDANNVFFNPFARFFIPFFLLLALFRRRRRF